MRRTSKSPKQCKFSQKSKTIVEVVIGSIRFLVDSERLYVLQPQCVAMIRLFSLALHTYLRNISARKDLSDPPADLVADIVDSDSDTFLIHSQVVARASLLGSLADPRSWSILPTQPQSDTSSDLWAQIGSK